jgi:hypothetical protein
MQRKVLWGERGRERASEREGVRKREKKVREKGEREREREGDLFKPPCPMEVKNSLLRMSERKSPEVSCSGEGTKRSS